MNSLKITQDNLESTVNGNETLVIQFVLQDADALPDKRLAGIFPNTVFAHVNIAQEPSLARMFSVGSEPAVAIFRQKIILYLENGAPDSEQLGYLLQKISMLDMDKIRMNIEKEKAAQALHMRRACPTIRAKTI